MSNHDFLVGVCSLLGVCLFIALAMLVIAFNGFGGKRRR